MSIPDGANFDMASRFYRVAWGTREGTALFINASHAWFLDLEVRSMALVTDLRTDVLFLAESRTTYSQCDRFVCDDIALHLAG